MRERTSWPVGADPSKDAGGPLSVEPGPGLGSCYAHSLPAPFAVAHWELLAEHLLEVSALADAFAGAFGAAEWGRLAGEWHDLGKVQPEFQSYIRGLRADGSPHAWVGAVAAARV